jgi:DNA replication and repair protein RecF
MKLRILRLECYRNIAFAELVFTHRCVFFEGPNGQGKSNILESISLLTALRSFRGHGLPFWIQHGKDQAQLYFEGRQDAGDLFHLRMKLRRDGKQLWRDEECMRRSTDWIGLYPVVAFSNRDRIWMSGGPKERRQFFDMLLCQLDADYLRSLQHYYLALKQRNAALKQSQWQVLSSFESILSREAVAITHKRQQWTAIFNEHFVSCYRKISCQDSEQPHLHHESDTAAALLASEDFWRQAREKDKLWQATQHGIHRDEYLFKLQNNNVRFFASEGQQENIILAMNLAQVELLRSFRQETPLILLDDIGKSLDAARRAYLWDALPQECQVFACGTEFPQELNIKEWQIGKVKEGTYCL